MKRKYYPTPEQALTILEENLHANFIVDSMYDIPFVYPCDQTCHFHFDVMDIVTTSDHDYGKRLEMVKDEWDKEAIEDFKIHFYKYKQRHIDWESNY
ncbi:hypothetical protein XaC1_268 [Xanthomonas phage XaC1]|nr:hypothetical protein XaC1_268 [Xanthomonas phage XaC1]